MAATLETGRVATQFCDIQHGIFYGKNYHKYRSVGLLGKIRKFFSKIRNPAAIRRFVMYRYVLHRVRNALRDYDLSAHSG